MNEVTPQYTWRTTAVRAVMLLLVALLILRLLGLQIREVETLQAAGDARSVRTIANIAYRGMISDRQGRPLAISTPVQSLWLDPGQFDQRYLPTLATALQLDESHLAKRLSRMANRDFMYVKRHLAPSQANSLLDQGIPGLYSQTEYKRFYPAADVAAHLIGFTDTEQRGVDGLEWTYDSLLRGRSGSQRVLKSRGGKIIQHIDSVEEVKHGQDLQLSIDLRLQYYAYKELKAAVAKFNAVSGSMVLLDVQTNEVLALVNEPSYNPNQRQSLRPEQVRNRAITDVVEPGSTMKPLTMVAALESGLYDQHSVINTSPGYINVEGKLLTDMQDYGELSMAGILKKSSQVGTTRIALDVGGDRIRNVMQRFGVGQSLATGFPGESFGLLPDHTSWHPLQTVTMAYGYGVAMTPLQLAQAYSVLANDGMRKDVSLVRVSGEVYSQRVVSSEITRQITAMLAHTSDQGGTATLADMESYSVAGKTGTLHRLGEHGYEGDKYVAVFAGFAPVGKPRIAAAVVIDNPRSGTYYGGEVAAPVFSRVVGESLRLLNVVPDQVRFVEAH